MIREKILILKVYPSYHVHLIPKESLSFVVHLVLPVTQRDISDGVCLFQIGLDKKHIESGPIEFVNERLIKCSLVVPSTLSLAL